MHKYMTYIYFLTVDKCSTKDTPPTRGELLKVKDDICECAGLSDIAPFKVQCFENKRVDMKGKVFIHYHCLLQSRNPFIQYKLIRKEGYSLKLLKLKSYFDVARTAGYIMKYKKDKIEYKYKFI